MSSVAYPFILSLSNNFLSLSSYIYLSHITIPQSKTTSLHANHRLSVEQQTKHRKLILLASATKMCIKIVERYAVCQCIYTTHAVDPCSRVGLRDHSIILKEVLVGYTCPRHSATGAQPSSSSTYQSSFPDSGYGSGGYTQQHRAEYRRC